VLKLNYFKEFQTRAAAIGRLSLLWPTYGIRQEYFHPVISYSIFYLSFSSPILSPSAVADWMSTILPHMVWP